MKEKESVKKQETNGKKPSVAKKIVSAVVTVFLLLLLGFVIFTLIQVKTAKRPNLFGYGVYTVISGSMRPTLDVGDVIIVKKVGSESELKKGDIVTFVGKGELSGKIVTHRIISEGVEDGKLTTCGDANYGIADKPIEYTDVIGKYVRTSVVMTFVYNAFRSKLGFGLIVFVPLFCLLVIQIINFVRACKMKDDEELKKEQLTPEELIKQREDEIKRKAVEEYIASKKRVEEAQRKRRK